MAAEAQTVTAPGTISPKVFWPLVVAVVLMFIGSFLAAVTPEMLSFLGPFAVPMAISLTAVSNVVMGYLKSDELRDLGVKATAAVLAVEPTSTTVPTTDGRHVPTAAPAAPVSPDVQPVTTGSSAVAVEPPLETSDDSAAARMRAELQGGV